MEMERKDGFKGDYEGTGFRNWSEMGDSKIRVDKFCLGQTIEEGWGCSF